MPGLAPALPLPAPCLTDSPLCHLVQGQRTRLIPGPWWGWSGGQEGPFCPPVSLFWFCRWRKREAGRIICKQPRTAGGAWWLTVTPMLTSVTNGMGRTLRTAHSVPGTGRKVLIWVNAILMADIVDLPLLYDNCLGDGNRVLREGCHLLSWIKTSCGHS